MPARIAIALAPLGESLVKSIFGHGFALKLEEQARRLRFRRWHDASACSVQRARLRDGPQRYAWIVRRAFGPPATGQPASRSKVVRWVVVSSGGTRDTTVRRLAVELVRQQPKRLYRDGFASARAMSMPSCRP